MTKNNTTHLILENVCSFSKRDHHWWTLYGDETRAYDPKTLEFVDMYADAYFPDGMGIIQGWALSVHSEYRDYTYILAECEDYQIPEGDEDTLPGEIITVNSAIWLPTLEFFGWDCNGSDWNLRENPPDLRNSQPHERGNMLDINQELYESIAKELPDFLQNDFSRILTSVNWAKEFVEANIPDWAVQKFGVEACKTILKKGSEFFKSRFPYFQNDPTNFENMQRLFTKALSGDLEKPGAYSLRGLNKISEMNAEVTQLFTKLCSISMLCIENRMDYKDLNCIQPKEVTSDRIIDITVFDFNTHTGNALSNTQLT